MGRQGVQQVGHHFQVDHRRLIDHQYIQRQWVTGVMTEVPRARTTAQQPVHGGHIAGDFLPNLFSHFQGLHLMADGLSQPRRGFTGGCREANAQWLTLLHGRRLQQGQQPYNGSGFAGAGAAGDDAEGAARRQRAGELLPIDQGLRCGIGLAEQRIKALRQIQRRRFLLRQTLTQRAVDSPFVTPVATQVQASIRQHQRLLTCGFTVITRLRDQYAGRQRLTPGFAIQRHQQLRRQQHRPGLHIALGR